MHHNPHINLTFRMSAARLEQLPNDDGREVAIIGSSNVGKSTLLNAIANNKSLARTGKTPGVTKLINVFSVTAPFFQSGVGEITAKNSLPAYLIDLPGYGYAKVAQEIRDDWHKLVNQYLETRKNLVGLFLLMDSRHPFKLFDCELLSWTQTANLPVCVVFTKLDKLNAKEKNQLIKEIYLNLNQYGENISHYLISAVKRLNIEAVVKHVNAWLEGC